jgi:hypothetical protein
MSAAPRRLHISQRTNRLSYGKIRGMGRTAVMNGAMSPRDRRSSGRPVDLVRASRLARRRTRRNAVVLPVADDNDYDETALGCKARRVPPWPSATGARRRHRCGLLCALIP